MALRLRLIGYAKLLTLVNSIGPMLANRHPRPHSLSYRLVAPIAI